MPAHDDGGFVESVWYGRSVGARAARAMLTPAAWLYGSVVRARGALYDRGMLRVAEGGIPVLSVGNVSVGGTGKTPIAAWVAAELASRGARPAIVLRGYGDDEPLVHRVLNPSVPVHVAADRASGIAAARRGGCDVVVLDDAFQHRRAQRSEDWVLISADDWATPQRLLPAGPWREPLRAIRRASLVIVTRKAAGVDAIAPIIQALKRSAPRVPVAVMRLAPGGLHRATTSGAPTSGPAERETSEAKPLSALTGRSVLAIAAIGNPRAFATQLHECAPSSVDFHRYPDHHAFTPAEIARLVSLARDVSIVVCTLKDAVKLAPQWPREAPPLWYVSQRVEIENGDEFVSARLDAFLEARVHPETVATKRDPRP